MCASSASLLEGDSRYLTDPPTSVYLPFSRYGKSPGLLIYSSLYGLHPPH